MRKKLTPTQDFATHLSKLIALLEHEEIKYFLKHLGGYDETKLSELQKILIDLGLVFYQGE